MSLWATASAKADLLFVRKHGTSVFKFGEAGVAMTTCGFGLSHFELEKEVRPGEHCPHSGLTDVLRPPVCLKVPPPPNFPFMGRRVFQGRCPSGFGGWKACLSCVEGEWVGGGDARDVGSDRWL